jgi:hypothetical protein
VPFDATKAVVDQTQSELFAVIRYPAKKNSDMITNSLSKSVRHTLILTLFSLSIVFGQTARDLVKGNLIQFNDNGAWCWYQDERAIIDAAAGKLVVGSVASSGGAGGSLRNGIVESVIFDLRTGMSQRFPLWQTGCDDHNAPGFILRPDGKYLAMYSAHYDAYNSRYRIYDGGAWTPEQRFDWTKIPGGTDYTIAYSNLYYLSSESRMYAFARANHRCPNLIVSTDIGDTWSFGGQLTTNSTNSYNKGYYKYWGNGVDRIDFIFTEEHPRDNPTNMYHGYIKNGKSYASDGTLADGNIFDTLNIPTFLQFTKIFAEGTVINGDTMRRCWNVDVQRYDDGVIAAIISCRANNNQQGGTTGNPPPDLALNPDHRFIYCRYDRSTWSYTYLGKAGWKMYNLEPDYTGLGALCPNDPNTLYISTSFDPRDNTDLTVREIFKGVTTNKGASWTWTPITQKSVRDNFRPIVPAWDNKSTALLWWRGTYTSAQNFNAAVVGILDRRSETNGVMRFVDATPANTSMADGSLLVTTGPDTNAGVADSKWHLRTGVGNGSSVFTSAEAAGENAPALRTRVPVPSAGTYDVWANFWAVPTTSADWRIRAGLSSDGMQLFRSMACRQVEAGDHNASLTLSGTSNTFLYQAYLGRVEVSSSNSSFDVFVDDDAVRVGTTNTLVGDNSRTWYDGISYASVNTVVSVEDTRTLPTTLGLSQNYPNPFNPTTAISYQLSAFSVVTLKVFDMLGREVATLVNDVRAAGPHHVVWDASGCPSGVYVYRLQAGNSVLAKKMVLMK